MALSNPPGAKPLPTLPTLPSEVRRVIVSSLAPDPDNLRPGCKNDLKNANSAHSCLREWVTEYLFRYMALPQVLPGTASHLERFSIIPANTELIKHVKHIAVQVPPAVRWEVGVDNPFSLHQEEHTFQRLCSKFGIKNPRHMSTAQHEYCSNYHRAMVEPFTDNRRWHQLYLAADCSWQRIFRSFPYLEAISVGCCGRTEQPAYTYTHVFVLQHGKSVVEDVYPKFVEDATVNMAWASSLVCAYAPPSVRSLSLTMANMDNLNSSATINRLLSLSYSSRADMNLGLWHVTKVSLTIRGIAGVHGAKDWDGDTGTAGSVRYWKKVLNLMQGLQHLELRNGLTADEEYRMTALEHTDTEESVLGWLLPGLVANQLQTLRLADFSFNRATVTTTLNSGHWPYLRVLMLDDVQLKLYEKPEFDDVMNILKGRAWMEVCLGLTEQHSGLCIELNRPVSSVVGVIGGAADHRLYSKYVEEIEGIPGVQVDVEGYGQYVRLTEEEVEVEEEEVHKQE